MALTLSSGVLLLCLIAVQGYQEKFNWIGNGNFAGEVDAKSVWGSYGKKEIVSLSSRGLKAPPVGDGVDKPQYMIWFPPRSRGGGEYEIHAVKSMSSASAGKYIISAWVYIDANYNGHPLTLHSRWWTNGWRVMGTTGGNLNNNIRDKWQYVETHFTCSQRPIQFSLYLGYPMTNSRGNMYVTNIRISKFKDCEKGYSKKEGKCVDVDECKRNNGGCHPKTKCKNHEGGYICTQCPTGYYRPKNSHTQCLDVDECKSNNGGCATQSKCKNTVGSFRCGPCAKGYRGSPAISCNDIDECESGNGSCDIRRECINTIGSFKCGQCKVGFKVSVDGNLCEDVNECEINNGGCDDLTTCMNRQGSSGCGPCPFGYSGDGKDGCIDENECKKNNGGCDAKANCINTPGSRECSACPKGFTGSGDTKCEPEQKEKRETKEDIANMASEKSAARTATMYDSQKVKWVGQEAARREDVQKDKEIKTLSARLANLNWVAKIANEDRMKKEATTNYQVAADILDSGKHEVASIYRKHFQNTTGITVPAAAVADSQTVAN